MKKLDYCVLLILVISPIIVNVLLGIPAICPVYGDTSGWLGFFGSFTGAIIPMFILYRTRQWNKEDNDETRRGQQKILQYQAKKVWFEELKKKLDDNYRLLDLQQIAIITNNIILENYQVALTHLMQLNRNVEMQGYSFDFCLGGSETEEEYVDSYNELLTEYGMLVNDLILICDIGNVIQQGEDYQKFVRDSYNKLNRIHNKKNIVEVSPFIEELNKMVYGKKSINEIIDVCKDRMSDTINVQMGKEKLIVTTKTLLKSKEQEIENILK